MNFLKTVPPFKHLFSFFLVIALLMATAATAQPYNVPAAQQPAYFVYAEATRADGRLKVLFVSRHIIRMKDSELPNIETDLHLDFGKKVEGIPHAERYFSSDAQNIAIRTVSHEEIYGTALNWTLTHNYYGSVKTTDNTLSAMEKIREAFIRDYQSKGYKVFQIDFAPNLAGGANYNYYDTKKGVYVNWQLERVSALSPLWIPYYQVGEIRDMLSRLSTSTSGGGSLTVESSNKKTSSGNKSSSNTSRSDNTDWEAMAMVKRAEAEAYEAEGDRLMKLGALFLPKALEQYKLAQQAMPNARVQQKINNINNQVILAQGINRGLENLEDASEGLRSNLDDAGISRLRAGQLAYSGLMPSGKPQLDGPTPWSASLTYGFYRIFALEAGVFYGQMPVYQVHLTDKQKNKTGQSILLNHKSGGWTLTAGIAVPIKSSVVLYGMAGGNLPMFNVDPQVLTPGYEYSDPLMDLNEFQIQGKLKFGMHLKVPKTRLGFSVFYAMQTINGEKVIEGSTITPGVKYGETKHYVGMSDFKKYTYSQLGISLLFLSKNPTN